MASFRARVRRSSVEFVASHFSAASDTIKADCDVKKSRFLRYRAAMTDPVATPCDPRHNAPLGRPSRRSTLPRQRISSPAGRPGPADHRSAGPAPAADARAARWTTSPAAVGHLRIGAVADRERQAGGQAVRAHRARRRARTARWPTCSASPPPSRRAALEIELEKAQRLDSYQALQIPAVRPGPRLPTEALEALVGLHRALAAVRAERAATPEEARRSNAALRQRMRDQDNYFADVEKAAADLLHATNYVDRPDHPHRRRPDGRATSASPWSTPATCRSPPGPSPTWRNRRIYLPQPDAGQHDSRSLALQALGHVVLGHQVPRDYGEFLEQRVEVNYFAAALLMPEKGALTLLRKAKAAKDIAIEDLRDAYGGLLRDGRAPVHQPGHPAPRPAGALHADLVVRDHLQGLRERRRALPHRRHRRDRGPAGVPVLDGPRGVRAARPVVGLPAVHRHRLRDLLVHRGRRPDAGRHVLGVGRACPTSTSSGCAAARPPTGRRRAAPTRPAARCRRPTWRRAGRAWPGRAPGCTRTCWPRCRPGSSPASTTPTSCGSWTASSPDRNDPALGRAGPVGLCRALPPGRPGTAPPAVEAAAATSGTKITLRMMIFSPYHPVAGALRARTNGRACCRTTTVRWQIRACPALDVAHIPPAAVATQPGTTASPRPMEPVNRPSTSCSRSRQMSQDRHWQ